MNTNPLTTTIAGLTLKNPTILASGILGYTAESLQTIAEAGAAAVITKSIGAKPRTGYPNPTIVQTKHGIINAMGLPNPGINAYTKEIKHAKTLLPVPLIVSIYGYTPEEYAATAKKATKAGADAIELNVSCPHVKETGTEIGQNPKVLTEVIQKVKTTTDKPLIVKLSPNVTDITTIAETAEKAGANALTATNTIKALAIDTETTLPILSNTHGGLSGPAIKPVALRCTYDIYKHVKIPIIGCGGITTWQDAVEFLLAGATAIQIGTAIATKNTRVFKTINHGITTYLKNKNHRSITEIVGLSHHN